MSGLLNTNAAVSKIAKEHYVIVLIDADKGHNADVVKRYGDPTRFGLPVLVVLESDGKLLTTQDTGQLEQGNHHDPVKVITFLQKWKKPKASDKTQK